MTLFSVHTTISSVTIRSAVLLVPKGLSSGAPLLQGQVTNTSGWSTESLKHNFINSRGVFVVFLQYESKKYKLFCILPNLVQDAFFFFF